MERQQSAECGARLPRFGSIIPYPYRESILVDMLVKSQQDEQNVPGRLAESLWPGEEEDGVKVGAS